MSKMSSSLLRPPVLMTLSGSMLLDFEFPMSVSLAPSGCPSFWGGKF